MRSCTVKTRFSLRTLTLHTQSFLLTCGQTRAQTGCYRCTGWPHAGKGRVWMDTPAWRKKTMFKPKGKHKDCQIVLCGLQITLAAFPTRGFSGVYSSLAGRTTWERKTWSPHRPDRGIYSAACVCVFTSWVQPSTVSTCSAFTFGMSSDRLKEDTVEKVWITRGQQQRWTRYLKKTKKLL